MKTNPILFYTKVWKCTNCNTWLCRFPKFLEGDSKGENCEKCGCTSFNVFSGRPIGKKSKYWSMCVGKWAEMEDMFMEWHKDGSWDMNDFVLLKKDKNNKENPCVTHCA